MKNSGITAAVLPDFPEKLRGWGSEGCCGPLRRMWEPRGEKRSLGLEGTSMLLLLIKTAPKQGYVGEFMLVAVSRRVSWGTGCRKCLPALCFNMHPL